MRSDHQILFIVGLFVLPLPLLGCGGVVKNPIVQVEGKVAIADGKKLPVGTRVVFQPVEGQVRSAVGTTTEDGSFQTIHSNGSTGAEEGKYTLKLLPPEENAAEFQKVVPKQYQSDPFAFAEVKPGMSPLDLKVPAAK